MKAANLAMVESPDTKVSDLDQARLAAERQQATLAKLEHRRDGLQLAFQADAHGIHDEASSDFRKKALEFADFVKASPRRAKIEIEDLSEEIDGLKHDVAAAVARYHSLAETASDQFAQTLMPRHRVAVGKIAKALEGLSIALAEETAVQAELAAKFPMFPRSARLPNMSGAFRGCALDDPMSAASHWARAARDWGLL